MLMFKRILSVEEGSATGQYIVTGEFTENNESLTLEYVLSPDDSIGLAPDIRKALNQWISDGHIVSDYTPPAIVAEDVNFERDRRLYSGFQFNGVRYDFSREALDNINSASIRASLAIQNKGVQSGDFRWHGQASDFEWIAADNTRVPMDAQTVLLFADAAGQWKSGHYLAARALKDMSPIPAHFQSNDFWP